MKTLVFVGSKNSGSSREAIKAAERLGYYTVLLTDRKTFVAKRAEFPDVHLMQLCNLMDREEMKNIIRRLQVKALEICTIISFADPHCSAACYLADEFGVNRFSAKALENMENKLLSRELVSKTLYGPMFIFCSPGKRLPKAELLRHFPLIVKSPVSSGSKDVYRVSNYTELTDRVRGLFKKYPDVPVLVEEFLDGPQFLVEAVVHDGKINVIALIEQEITLSNNHYIVTGYSLILEPEEKFYASLIAAVTAIVNAHSLATGPCHVEMRYVKNEWKLIEINPRISGAGMNRMLEIGLGISLVEETLKLALGQEPDLNPRYKKHTYSKYVVIKDTGKLEQVIGRKRAARCPGVEEVYVKPRKGSLLTPPYSMGNRYAYVIATGSSATEAKKNARHAASQIQFVLKDSLSENETAATRFI